MLIGLYAFIAFVVAACFGIPKVWKNLDNDWDLYEATLDGGCFGVFAGVFWPISLWALLIGVVTKKARDEWKAAQGGKKDE